MEFSDEVEIHEFVKDITLKRSGFFVKTITALARRCEKIIENEDSVR